MNRGQFVRSIIGVLMSPRIVAEINISSNKSAIINTPTSCLIEDISILTPIYAKRLVDKFSTKQYSLLMNILQDVPLGT